MKKLIPIMLIGLLVCLLATSVSASMTATIYATGDEGIPGFYAFFHLTTTETETGKSIDTASAEESSLNYFHIMQLSEINPSIKALLPSTYTVTYYGFANVSDKAQFCIMAGVLSNEMLEYWKEESYVPIEFWELAGIESKYVTEDWQAYSELIQTTNQSLIGTAEMAVRLAVEPTDWIVAEWGINKTDTTKLNTTLYFDAQHSPVHPTKIDGIEYLLDWGDAVSPIWYIVLPLMFLISVSLYFIKVREGNISTNDIIAVAIAFLMACILIPIALNILYAS